MKTIDRILNYGESYFDGMVTGLKWYVKIIRYESKWYILALILDVLLLPIKIPVTFLLGIFQPDWFMKSDFFQDMNEIYEEMEED